jgi:hypothetical protein
VRLKILAPVFLLPSLRIFFGGDTCIVVEGGTLRQLIDTLASLYPGIKGLLLFCVDPSRLAMVLAAVIVGAPTILGKITPLESLSDVLFLTAIAGG